MSVYLAKLKMSSGGPSTGKSWTHNFAIQSDLSLSSDSWQGNVEDFVNATFKTLYNNNVYFDDMTISDLAKNEPGEAAGSFIVIPLSIQGARTGIAEDNDRTALETCLTIKAYSGSGRPSVLWLRGALMEDEVLFNPGGGWTYNPPGTGDIPGLLAAIDLTGLPFNPGKVNMKTRDADSFAPWTSLIMGAILPRQTRVQKKAPPPKNESSLLERLGQMAPLAAGILAFILTKGKAGLSPAVRTSIIASAGSIGSMLESAIAVVTADDP